jgi:hypothetical protein
MGALLPLVIVMAAALGGIALGLGMFILGKPPPARLMAQQRRVSLDERLGIHGAASGAQQKRTGGPGVTEQ